MRPTKLDYDKLRKGFMIQSLIWATISTLAIEIRRSIFSTEQKPLTFKNNTFQNITTYIFFTLRTLPYDISYRLNLLNKKGDVPEYVKALYTFSISFILSLSVYYFFLFILGYKNIYEYFFGWTEPKGIRVKT